MTSRIKVGIISASDRSSKGEREDKSGLLLKFLVEDFAAEVIVYKILPDDEELLKKELCSMSDELGCDLILTTGGTGLSPKDHTPDATREVIEKEVPGISEAIRQASLITTQLAMLSRAISGIRGRSLIINLPGSPEAVRDAFKVIKPILQHAVSLLKGTVHDCQETRQQEWKRHTHTSSSLSCLHS